MYNDVVSATSVLEIVDLILKSTYVSVITISEIIDVCSGLIVLVFSERNR